VRKHAPDSRDEDIEFDWFGIELVASRGNGLLAFALQRMRGHADDWDFMGMRIGPETSHGFPAVNDRHFEVHQNDVRVLGHSQFAATLTIASRENLEISKQLKASLEHVHVVVVVFDVEYFRHERCSSLSKSGYLFSEHEQLIRNCQADRLQSQSQPGVQMRGLAAVYVCYSTAFRKRKQPFAGEPISCGGSEGTIAALWRSSLSAPLPSDSVGCAACATIQNDSGPRQGLAGPSEAG
jgi:hypothetical protein